VKIDVHIPEEVTDEQREVLDEMREKGEKEKSFFETVKDFVG
jgi:DnaJ-class molecular chaperone